MKSNIQQVPYNKEHPEQDKCVWWSYNEVCDDCGDTIHTFGTFMTTTKPNVDEKDYCINCLRKNLDKMYIEKVRNES